MKTLEIYRDDNPTNPRIDFDQFGTLYIPPGNRYLSGDKNAQPISDDFDGVYLPVFAYIHGSITIKAGEPFTCPWDSGQIGIIYVSRDKINAEKISDNQALQNLKAEIELYNQYLNGEVYGFILRDNNTEEEIDSCWGFFGDDYNTNGIRESVNLEPGDTIVFMESETKQVIDYKETILEVVRLER